MTEPSAFRFSVGASPFSSPRELIDHAVKAEALGLYGLCVADHPGITPSPFTRLAAVAAATTTLRLIPYVLNCGVREPLEIASEAATLDAISDGRLTLGLGAGHTPVEWTMTGRPYPSANERVARLAEVAEVVRRLLAGEVVSWEGTHVAVTDAFLFHPRPVQDPIPLLIGGNGRRLVRLAAELADVISLTGLGATLEDGHRHEALWDAASIDARIQIIREATARTPTLDVLVQHLEITDNRAPVADRLTHEHPDLTVPTILNSPHVLIGTVDELVEEILGYRERWGFTSYVVPAAGIDDAVLLSHALGESQDLILDARPRHRADTTRLMRNPGAPLRSGFSDVDESGATDSLVAYLDSARLNPAMVRAKRWSIEQLELSPGALVVDVGCGTGEDVMVMSEQVTASGAAIGVDSSSVMVGEASKRAREARSASHFQVADAHRLPFKDGAFDAARTERTLQHLADPDQAVHELTRVLKPGGRLAIIEPDWETMIVSGGDDATSRAVRAVHIMRTAQPRIGRRLYGLLHANGFSDVRIEGAVITVRSLSIGTTAVGLDRAVNQAAEVGLVTHRQAQQWSVEIHAADAESRFFWSIVNFCVAGCKQ